MAAVVLSAFLLVIVVVKTQSTLLLGILIAWVLFGAYLLFRVRCPQCGVTVAYQGKIWRIPIYGGYANRNCKGCGFDLTATSVQVQP
jgi:uncharacterized membrane protein